MKKEIRIYLSHKQDVSSYGEVQCLIDFDTDIINTYCLDFFSWEYYDKGYDVVMLKYNQLEPFMYIELIRLSELLDPEKRKQYTDKEIRKSHDVLKMFKAGAFKLKGE